MMKQTVGIKTNYQKEGKSTKLVKGSDFKQFNVIQLEDFVEVGFEIV